jgi:hypothetical protein
MNPYEEKQERRKQRLLNRAAKLREKSNEAQAKSLAAIAGIPFGQPVLVGHHSEKRHRAAIHRAQANATKAYQFLDQAKAVDQRAESVGEGGISSDDPDAVKKLTEKLEGMKSRHAAMKAGNKENLRQYRSYELANSSANIRRVENRIADLSRPKRVFEPIETAEYRITLDPDPAGNRYVCKLKNRVEKDVFKSIRQAGWLWSPGRSAFVRKPGPSISWGLMQLKQIFEKEVRGE